MAFYRDGREPASILRILSNSSLYDYYGEVDLDEVKGDIMRNVRAEVEVILPNEEYREVDMGDQILQAALDTAFTTHYKEDLRKWTDVLVDLEEKGYSRNEIVALLYQESAHKWQALARRMPIKSQL